MQKNITDIMQREMTRKEFIATLGLGVASIMGLSTILRMLTGKSLGQSQSSRQASNGYGASPYGR